MITSTIPANMLVAENIKKITPSTFNSIINTIEYQKAYLFRISLPDLDFGLIEPNPNEKFDYCISSTSFPVMTTATQLISFYNSELKIAKNTTFSNWSAIFKLDLNGVVSDGTTIIPGTPTTTTGLSSGGTTISGTVNSYQYFYTWQSSIFNKETRISYLPAIYKKSIDLFLLNEKTDEVPVSSFTLEGAFPVSVNGGNLSYSDDGILTYNVEFAFDRFILGATIK